MPPADRFVTDTDVLRRYARHLDGAAESLDPARDTFSSSGPAAIPAESFRSRTGWLQVLDKELRAFRDSYQECQYGTSRRLQRISDALVGGARLLREAADRYDRSDADAADLMGKTRQSGS